MKTKILMVCLGNICRSPLAEGVLKSKLDSKKYSVASAGTGGYHIGALPDPRSLAVAKTHGLDISDQRAAKFETHHFDSYDHIYVMDQSNYTNVIAIARNQADRDKVKLILDLISPGENLAVPDPYYGGEQGFENVYQLLDKACDVIAKQLQQ